MTSRRRFALSIALGCAGALVSVPASAQEQPGYASNLSNPSERGSSWFMLDSLDLRGDGRLAVGMVHDYSYRSLLTFNPDGAINGSIVRNQYTANLGAAVMLASRVRLGINVPLQLHSAGHTRTIDGRLHRGAEGTAVGDVRFAADARLFGTSSDAATLAVGTELFLPSGSTEAYTGDGKPRVLPRILFAGEIGRIAYAARAGVMIRGRNEDFIDGRIGTSLVYGASAGAWLLDHKLLVGPEVHGSTVFADAFERRTTPIEVLLGAHYDVGANIRIGAGAGTLLAPGYGAAVARGLLSLEWVPGDAKEDAPPPPPPPPVEPAKVECPEPPPPPPPPQPPPCPACADPDRDKDGITNEADACPDQAGPADADAKKSGCPKAFLENGVIKIAEQVKFRTASAEIDAGKQSQDVLEAVLAVLKAHPEIGRLRIEGHTDDRGNADNNKALSKARAEAVVAWLAGKGIERSKLTAEGVGQDRPIESNATEAGRAANRRVELHVEQGSSR